MLITYYYYYYYTRLAANLPLSPIADACRIARNSLVIIANSKPKTFILAIAKEIKRLNATSPSSLNLSSSATVVGSGVGPGGLNFPYGSVLSRGKGELLLIIEKLMEHQSQDVFELISDVIEIVLFCLDSNQIRSSGLEESFTPLLK